jgi:hypothetical protein
MDAWKCVVLAGAALTISVVTTSASADDQSFKANFSLHADSAVVSDGELRLANVNPVVFVVESDSDTAYGVTESATSFLERWATLDHTIRPQGILFANGSDHEVAYRTVRFEIDDPSKAGSPADTDWVFEINHLVDGAGEHFGEGQVLQSVMLTVVMEHTPIEVSEGRVCGPWDPSTLAEHHELMN